MTRPKTTTRPSTTPASPNNPFAHACGFSSHRASDWQRPQILNMPGGTVCGICRPNPADPRTALIQRYQ